MDPRKSAVAQEEPVKEAGDRWLDHALEDSFPASDPIAAHLFD